jgi:DNA-binding response OmpR family regulator
LVLLLLLEPSAMSKILIVDDDTRTAQLIAAELNKAGHQCGIRANGNDVLEIAQKESLDLLILDVMLPDISGFEICRQVRRDGDLYVLPIVFVSAMNGVEEIQHGLEQGADAYITKPFQIQELINQISRLLQITTHSDYIDEITESPNAEGIRKLIQQHISRNETFSLVYTETEGMREIYKDLSEENRNKILRHAARALKKYGNNFSSELFNVGHMGGGHFISIVPEAEAQQYCKHVRRGWHKHKDYLNEKIDNVDINRPGLLEMNFCITTHELGEYVSAAHLIDTISKIHKMADTMGSVGGIQVDRRIL